jgi:hypothetical protein
MDSRFSLEPREVRHVLWPNRKGTRCHWLQCRRVETAAHAKPPRALNDNNVFVHRVHVRHDHVACFVVSAQGEDLAPPRHVHVYRDGKPVVKWDLDNEKAMKGAATRRILELIAQLESEGLL